MPGTIKCTNCGVALNLPPQALGRRLKCPKCGVKFHAAEAGAQPSASQGNGKGHGLADSDRPSTLELSRRGASHGDLPALPNSPGDLRDTFTLPMMTEADITSLPSKPNADPNSDFRDDADVTSLFKDDPKPRKRLTGAEGRAQARRCPTCGGGVPIGMSICQRCGLDLDTNLRVDLMEDLAPPHAPAPEGVPILIGVIGGLCLALSTAMAIFAVVLWSGETSGAIYFIPVALFGAYASVQFLRRKSIKLLLIALTLGAVIDLIALVAMPVYHANQDIRVVKVNESSENPDSAGAIISSPLDQLDSRKVTTGFVILAIYAGVSVLLLSATVNKNFRR